MIGIIGGSGNVGRYAIRLLDEYTNEVIRAGCRKPESLYQDFPGIEVKKVDITEEGSISAFIEGCDLILNCAGPSSALSEKAVRVCTRYGCNYVDAGMNRCFKEQSEKIPDFAVIYAAGATPGLSGILPRWLGKQFDEIDELSNYQGSFGAFSKTAAADYLSGVFSGESETGMAWKNGSKQEITSRQDKIKRLPFFSPDLMISPYFDNEAETVAKMLKIKSGKWNVVFAGERIKSVLGSCRSDYMRQPEKVAEKLCAASKTDAAGRESYMIFLIEIKGKINGFYEVKTLLLKTLQPSLLTAAAAMLACSMVLNGKVAPGVYPFSELNDTDYIISKLTEMKGLELIVFDRGIRQLLETEEGEL